MYIKGVGVDVSEIKRFTRIQKNRRHCFFKNNFSRREINYCFSFKNPSARLAGTFAAKEAVFKCMGRDGLLFSSVEIVRTKNGKPEVRIRGRRQKAVFVSISYTKEFAIAIAIKQ